MGVGQGAGPGQAGPANKGETKAKRGGGKGTEHRQSGPEGELINGHQVEGGVGLPLGGSPQKGQRQDQGK